MSNWPSPQALLTVLIIGLVGGMSLGISVTVGISPDEFGISEFVLQNICDFAKKTMQGSKYYSEVSEQCSMGINLIRVISVVAFIVTIIGAILIADDWKLGLGIYFFGFIIGFYVIYSVLV
jgi:hypothetical protein